jgi:DNA adenine methylase
MKPLLKWAGGKRHIAHLVRERFPENWNSGTYFEPFIGGGAVYLELGPKVATIGDVNTNLVDFYLAVRDQPLSLLEALHGIRSTYDALSDEDRLAYFLQLRAQFNTSEPGVNKPALLFALNKLCFNGLYRENAKGNFNVPFGKKKKFPEFSDDHFLAASELLANASIMNADFEFTVSSAVAGDFVYFDPPYVPVNQTSNFTAYSSDGFDRSYQERLANLMASLGERGVNAVLSNSATYETEEIYAGLRMERISAPRMVSAKASGRGPVDELLIMNF